MHADVALRIRFQLQASWPKWRLVEGSMLEEREPLSCLIEHTEPAQAPKDAILEIGFQLPGFYGHFGVRQRRQVWIEDLHNVYWRAPFPGFDIEKMRNMRHQRNRARTSSSRSVVWTYE